MPEYIEREALIIENLEKYMTVMEVNTKEYGQQVVVAVDDLMYLPTADVVEVRHGKWFLLDECSNAGVYCSVCHKKVYKEHYANVKPKSNYCPNCGAKMDGRGSCDEID